MSRENKRNQMRKFNQHNGDFFDKKKEHQIDRYRDRDYPRQKNWASFSQMEDDDDVVTSWDSREPNDESDEQAA
ncbi:hypothetical protein LOC67_16590 [Stieleria sp. JC731]|uniref:hypothetical protein n=1 Tax=Pirellulaceae TaxID=2691357 RepID=UPI001E34CCE0|nr:hypothetical protein [Stieleria sp. JC731]MCC9602177.1 hypothetical protein [Stieleria sp. JC731]